MQVIYTHGNETPDEQQIGAHAALFLGPIRRPIQQDFLTFILSYQEILIQIHKCVSSAGVL